MLNNKEIGRLGEGLAKDYLTSISYDIQSMNYRTRNGEIDIIANDGITLVFIEVKTRTSILYGYPREAVNIEKQAKIRQIALQYIGEVGMSKRHIRFDVVEVMLDSFYRARKIHLIKNAF
jgi:putative endonuclease